ncbi:MAG: hypothetical protein JWN02_2139 [Acidobacteria bacterium]|nr:hypothetical protein [Acidobacteriota bacterium]
MFKAMKAVLGAAALLSLAIPPPAQASQAAACSRCKTDCYAQYARNLDDCSWQWWCQDLATSENNACIGGCITDVC